MTLRIAFTGTGYIAKIHARAAAKLPDVESVAVVNHSEESMDAFGREFSIGRKYPSVEAMLADGDVDAVSVNTPNALHAPETIACLRAGVHVMVEKPMAMDAGEARQMLEAAESSGARLMVAHCWRFDNEVLWLKERMKRIGRVVRTKSYSVHVHWGPTGWFTEKKLAGGGALADMGIHAIDTTRFLLGDPEPVSVYARVGRHYTDFDVDDTGVIMIDWQGGTSSYVEFGWWQPHSDGAEAATRLYGTEGLGSVYPTRLLLKDPQTKKPNKLEGGFKHPREPHAPQAMYDAQLAEFVESIKVGRTPSADGQVGLCNMRIVDAAYQSAESGKVVELS